MAGGLSQQSNLASRDVTTTDLDETVVQIGTVPIVYSAELDNTGNAAESVAKFFNAASVTLGTTEADEIVTIPALTKIMHHFNSEDGISFSVGCRVVCVTGQGTGVTTGPVNKVKAIIKTDGN